MEFVLCRADYQSYLNIDQIYLLLCRAAYQGDLSTIADH